ncbi:MAG TPA: hypothetical protein VJM34_17715 [Novosphingobium sp.]|nr:hypothetical protein [Novosphingobium sp.]
MASVPRLAAGAVALLALSCQTAGAHAFGTMYVLPIPLWMYAYSASATLIVSFAVVGIFVTHKSAVPRASVPPPERQESARPGIAIRVAGAASVALLALTIATGLFGTANPATNFGMTFFWIVFILGFAYLTAFIGDVYAAINPWAVVIRWVERAWPRAFASRITYPRRLGYWPSVAFYGLFIWIELFGHFGPRALGTALAAYCVLTIALAWLFGKEAWFRYGEFFGLFFRLIAAMAPVGREERAGSIRLVPRKPFLGLLREPAERMSLALFALFTLSSTAFDGVHETSFWVDLYWRRVWPFLAPLIDGHVSNIYAASTEVLRVWQSLMLVLSPFVYLAVFLLFSALTKWAARSELSVRELALRFVLTLVPIAFVYNVTHYYTLLLTEGPNIIRLVSDPFGFGWNLFGTRDGELPNLLPQAGSIWHFQVALILIGHIVSVYLAHVEALRLFADRGRAVRSQVPMLLLMVALTTIGLWILSLPIDSGAVVVPFQEDA